MIRALALAAWAAAVALGAERGAIVFEARREAARLAALKPAEAKIETRKAKPLSAPISRGGRMRGYAVVSLAYAVDVGAAAGRDIEPYLLDEAFSALYADAGLDPDHIEAYDLDRFKTAIVKRLDARLGAGVVRDVLVQEFNYVAASDLRR